MSVKKTTKRLYRYTFDTKLLLVNYTILNVIKETSTKYYLENGQHIETCEVYDYYADEHSRYCSVRLEDVFRSKGYVYAIKPVTANIRKEILESYIRELEYKFKSAQCTYENALKRSEEASKEADMYLKELNKAKDLVK